MNKFKQWLFNSKFFAVQKEELYRFTFDHAQDDLKELWIDNTDDKADEKAKKMLDDMISPIDFTSIVSYDKTGRIMYIGKESPTPMQLSNFKSEAEFIVQSSIWRILIENPKEAAQRHIFSSTETTEKEIAKSRAILYTVQMQQRFLDIFRLQN